MRFYIPAALALVFLIILNTSALPVQKQSNSYEETDPELTAGYYQGDMIISSSTERNGLRNESYRWPNNVVYYHINSYIDQDHRNHILRGLRILEENSCITFKEATTDQPYYVNVTSEPGGCYSYVGNLNHVQQLNLQNYPVDTGCFRLGTIVHEFLHALGFYHQQSASDRDNFVRIAEENVQAGMLHNFNKYTEEQVHDFGITYDYGSVMHYGPYSFSANGKMTIIPLEEGAELIMGQRMELSQSDIKKLRLMYRCPVKV